MVSIAFLCYIVLAWLRPRLALGVLLLLIPFGHLVRFAVAGIPFTFPEVAVYLLAAAIVLRRGISNFKFQISNFRDLWLVLPTLWVIVAAISAVSSPNPLRAWGIWKAYVVVPVLLFWIIRHAFQRTSVPSSASSGNDKCQNPNVKSNPNVPMPNDQHFLRLTSYVLLPIAASAFIVAAIAILQRWWPIGVPYPWSLPGKFRATSVFGYPNAVGLYLAPLVPLLVGAAITTWVSLRAAAKQSQPLRGARLPRSPAGSLAMTIIFGGAVLVSVLAIALARSTGALIALAVALPVLLFSAWRTSPKERNPTHFGDRRNGWDARLGARRAVGVVLVWILASLLLTAWLPYRHERPRWGPPLIQKLTFQQWSGSVRLAQYRETWQLLRDHPIRGAGLVGYQTAIAPYHEKQDVEIFLYPHNLLLAVWVELGLAGLLIFLAILYQFFKTVFSIQYSVFSIAMLVILVHGLVDVPYFKNDLAMVFWVIVAMAVIARQDASFGESARGAPAQPPSPSHA